MSFKWFRSPLELDIMQRFEDDDRSATRGRPCKQLFLLLPACFVLLCFDSSLTAMCSITGRLRQPSNKAPGQKTVRNIPLIDDMTSPLAEKAKQALAEVSKQEVPFGSYWQSMRYMPSTSRLILLSSSYDKGTWEGYVTKFDDQMRVTQTVNPGLGSGSVLVRSPVAEDENGITCAFAAGYVVTYDSRLDEVSRLPVHDSMITGLVAGNGGRFLTTCSTDQSISQVDVKTGVTRKKIRTAHLSHVLSIDCLPSNDSNIFLSCGKDKEIVSWDLRNQKAGTSFAFCNSCPSALQYCASDENYFLVGTYDSHVLLFDVRSNKAEVQARDMQVDRIHRIKRLDGGRVAVIGNHNVLNVVKELSIQSMYEGSALHTGNIRDAELIKGQLFSIGHGLQQLVKHEPVF